MNLTLSRRQMTFQMRPTFLLIFLLLCPHFPLFGQSSPAPRPLTVSAISAWKSIRSAQISDNGEWFSYHLVPNDGDSEVVLRAVSGETETRFPAGEGGSARPTFSKDCRWLAFLAHPSTKVRKSSHRRRGQRSTGLEYGHRGRTGPG
jgi:hypothetical protein